MLNKIRKFLLRQNGVSFIKKSEKSNSLYFNIGESAVIRVSDHIPTRQCRPEELHILTPVNSESFTILVNNRIAVIPNYNELKKYVKFYILTVGSMQRIICSVVKETVKVEKVVKKEVVIPVYEKTEGLSPDEEKLLDTYRRVCPNHKERLQIFSKEMFNSKASKKYRQSHGIK